MDKKRLLHIIEWAIAIAAYVYLVYELATYQHYDVVAAGLQAMQWRQWTAFALCVALMPVNMALEAWRWKTLMPMSFKEAHKQVYYSKLAGLVTPWRLGEYPARGMLMEQSPITHHPSPITHRDLWSRVLSMGAVGSATMTMAIVLAGVVALMFCPAVIAQVGNSYLYALFGIIVVLGVCLYFAPEWLKKWIFGKTDSGKDEIPSHLIWRSLGQSFIRLLCWCIQLALVLWALDSSLFPLSTLHSPLSTFHFPLSTFHSPLSTFHFPLSTFYLPIYYLLVTVTPNIPIAEVGVRGAWAMFLFGTPNAALAGVLLWLINTLLPCLIWPILRKKQ